MDTVENTKREIKRKTSQFMRKLLYIAVSLILLVLAVFIFRLDRFGFVEID
jgi:hypothetical protein